MEQTQLKSNNVISPKRRENIILSSVLFNKKCREFAIQNRIPTDVFDPNGEVKKLLDIFNGLVNANLPPTLDMLVEQSYPNDEDELQRQRLRKNLLELKKKVPPVELDIFKEHYFLLKKHNHLEALEKILRQTLEKVKEERNKPSYDKKQISIEFLQRKLDDIIQNFTPEEVKSLNLSEGLRRQVETINIRRKNPEITDTASSGYSALNEILSGGYRKGYFSLICARPAMGKTVFMLNQAVEAAKQGVKTLFISIEMSLEQCLQRVLSKISGIKMKKIMLPEFLSNQELNTLLETSKEAADIYGTNLFFEEVKSITPKQLETKILFYKKQFGVELVFVDYIQIMRTNAGKIPKEHSDFSDISYSLREVAKKTNVALVLGSQLSRDVEKRENKRPMDSDLKNSGSFEQDAAALIHLYRDEVYNKDTEDKNIIEVIVGKNRFGKGNETLRFSHDYSRQTIYQNAPAVA